MGGLHSDSRGTGRRPLFGYYSDIQYLTLGGTQENWGVVAPSGPTLVTPLETVPPDRSSAWHQKSFYTRKSGILTITAMALFFPVILGAFFPLIPNK